MTDNFEKKVAVDGPVEMRASLASTFSPGQALPAGLTWPAAGRWRGVRSFCGFCVTSRCNFCAPVGRRYLPAEQWRERSAGSTPLKQRKGDRCRPDSAIGSEPCRWNCWRPRRRPSALWGGGGLAMSAPPRPASAYGLRRVCWGMARSSFYAMPPASTPKPPAKRRGRSPRSRTRRCLAIEAVLEASPWEGATARSGLGFGRDIRVARKRVLRLMRENNLLSPHRCRPRKSP